MAECRRAGRPSDMPEAGVTKLVPYCTTVPNTASDQKQHERISKMPGIVNPASTMSNGVYPHARIGQNSTK